MRRIQDFFNKILCILLIAVLNSNVLLFAEDSLKLDGSYLVGCSFLEKNLFGMSNFRGREYEFTDSHLIVTDFKKKTKREIENLTAMNVESIEIIAKGIQIPEEQ